MMVVVSTSSFKNFGVDFCRSEEKRKRSQKVGNRKWGVLEAGEVRGWLYTQLWSKLAVMCRSSVILRVMLPVK